MATINNIKGTSYSSFAIGKRGVTIYQGTDVPEVEVGSNGDLFIQHGSSAQAIWQKLDGAWVKSQVHSDVLEAIANISPTADNTLGTDASGIVLRTPTQQRGALGLGTAATVNTGLATGNVPVIEATGKLPASIMPEITITRVFTVVDDEERDGLTVETGDIAIYSTNGNTFIYNGVEWLLMGIAGTVSAIIDANGESKTGIVHLDATDILTGVFGANRGGTGQSSYAQGDLLVGNDENGLDKLSIGTDDQYLTVKDGALAWSSLTALDIPFQANVANKISATNVGDAIIEAAAERVFVQSATTNPSATDDETDNFKVGDLWVNTTVDRVFVAVDVSSGAAIWSESSLPVMPANTRYVSANGNDASDGSLNRPWATVDYAMSAVSNGATIVIHAGTYSDDIAVSKNDITLVAMGRVKITGKVSVTGSNFLSYNIAYESSTTEAVNINAASGAKFNGGSIKHTTSTQVALLLSNAVGLSNVFTDVEIGKVSNTASTLNAVKFIGGGLGDIAATSGALIISNADFVGDVVHQGGFLQISGARTIKSLSSTAVAAASVALILENVSFRQEYGTYGNLTKTGSCDYEINDVDWYKTADLTGTRTYGRLARDIWADFTPANYSVAGSNIKAHLEGIDEKFTNISTTFQGLTDAANYSEEDADKILKVNADGTGIEFGSTLGSAASSNSTDFATAAQGVKADTAVQPGSLAPVATGGKFTDLSDAPALTELDAKKVLQVNAAGNALELGNPLHIVAGSGQYADLEGKPTLGTAAAVNIGTAEGELVALDATGKIPTSVLPELASGDKIETGDTSVQTDEVAGKVTVNASGQLVVTFDETGAVLTGTGDTAITSGAGEAITIKPGTATTGDAASMSISGGDATEAGAAGGHLVLSPGAAGAGGLAAQVKLASGYVPTSADSVVNKSYVDSRVSGNASITIVTADGNYTCETTDAYVLIKKTNASATQVTLPASPEAGKIVTIKDAKGDAATNNITIVAASGTIDGASSQVIVFNYEAISMIYNGTEWNLI